MNVLRNPVRQVLRRSYATAQRPFVPPAQLANVRHRPGGAKRRRRRDQDEDKDASDWQGELEKSSPSSPTFYTGRSEYFDQVILLQDAIVQARKSLKALYLLPLPEFARKSLPVPMPMWKNQEELSSDFQSPMSRSRYRRVIKLLNELNGYFSIAKAANASDVKVAIGSIVALFESGKKAASLLERQKKPVSLDQLGRSYSVGKRKTSSARVWIIPVHAQSTPMQTKKNAKEGAPDYEGITTSTILVNNVPLAEYFPLPADRERIMRPFKVAGVVGAYNVFALVRGGGTTGQSGALSHGIAKGLVVHEPKLIAVLKKAQLTRRDPRMVERKKTGLAKARKRYTWVKR
ncbi:hypothetical protein C0992_004144 [Termitomyces sp. T32_za158]|nr:hypothetical protein C0992_004144 [Termitomyces sp. T32_za158]